LKQEEGGLPAIIKQLVQRDPNQRPTAAALEKKILPTIAPLSG